MIASLAGRTTVFFSTHILVRRRARLRHGRDPQSRPRRARGRHRRAACRPRRRPSHRRRGRRPRRVAVGALRVAAWVTSIETHADGGLLIAVTDLAAAQRALPAAVAAAGLSLRGWRSTKSASKTSSSTSSAKRPRISVAPRRRGTPASRHPKGHTVVNGFGAFLKKESGHTSHLAPLGRTRHLRLCGLTSPATQLRRSSKATARSSPAPCIKVPPPTALDAYTQYVGNLPQLVLLAIVISGAGLISCEAQERHRRARADQAGVAPTAFVIAKAVDALALRWRRP